MHPTLKTVLTALAAALTLVACTTLTSDPTELTARIEAGLAACGNEEILASYELDRASRVVGPHKCREQRFSEEARRSVLVSEDRQVFYEHDKSCAFTLRNVSERNLEDTVTQFARENGWQEMPIICVLTCRRATCNGQDRCYGPCDANQRQFVDTNASTVYKFSWNETDEAANILRVGASPARADVCAPVPANSSYRNCREPGTD